LKRSTNKADRDGVRRVLETHVDNFTVDQFNAVLFVQKTSIGKGMGL
jgi:hypothetical protein